MSNADSEDAALGASSVVSWCRHCGAPRKMTREHIPPESTGNSSPITRSTDLFDQSDVLSEVADWAHGHVVRTLCQECNERASNWGYVGEYRRWVSLFHGHADRGQSAIPYRGGAPFAITLPYDVNPARFIRQAIGMLLAVQNSESLMAGFPSLARLVDSEPGCPSFRRRSGLSIEPARLYLSVCNANWSYLSRPMIDGTFTLGSAPKALWSPPGASYSVTELFPLALTPFLFILSAEPREDLGMDISAWTTWDIDRRPRKHERAQVIPTADSIAGGPRAMVYPKDYLAVDPSS
jgi:hypothetical protein